MNDREKLKMDVTVLEHDGPETAEGFEQYFRDMFQMYREIDVNVEITENGGKQGKPMKIIDEYPFGPEFVEIPDDVDEADVTIEEIDGGTRVTIEHELTPEQEQRFMELAEEGK